MGKVGLGTQRDSVQSEIYFGPDDARMQQIWRSGTIISTAVDAGATPTTSLRQGLLLGKITASGKLTALNPDASDGSQNFWGVLDIAQSTLDEAATAVDIENIRVCVARGNVKEKLLLLEGTALTASADVLVGKIKQQMRSRGFLFDTDLTSGVSAGAANGLISAGSDALSGAGAIPVTTFLTKWTTTGADAGTLADGTFYGQLKKILMVVDGGEGTLTPASLAGGTTITFADAGDFALLFWDGVNWTAVELGNTVDGVSAPVLA